MKIPEAGELWKNTKSGEVYEILDLARMEDDQSIVVVYKDRRNERWVRPLNKFLSRVYTAEGSYFRFILQD